MEAIIPPGGGPPLHIHHREEESFYLLEGVLDITLGKKNVRATTRDFVQIPRGTIRAFLNAGSTTARMLLSFSPAGMDKYFEEVLEPIQDRSAAIPEVTDVLLPSRKRNKPGDPSPGLFKVRESTSPVVADQRQVTIACQRDSSRPLSTWLEFG